MRRNIIHVCINVSVKNKRRKMFRDVAPACLWLSSALSLFCWRYSLVVCAGTHAVHWDAGARMHCWPGCIQRHSPSQPLAVRSRSSLAPAIAAAAKASGCFFLSSWRVPAVVLRSTTSYACVRACLFLESTLAALLSTPEAFRYEFLSRFLLLYHRTDDMYDCELIHSRE